MLSSVKTHVSPLSYILMKMFLFPGYSEVRDITPDDNTKNKSSLPLATTAGGHSKSVPVPVEVISGKIAGCGFRCPLSAVPLAVRVIAFIDKEAWWDPVR